MDGTFLVRPRDTSSFVLSVVFRGRSTHHLLTPRPADGVWLLNNKQLGPATTVAPEVRVGWGGGGEGWGGVERGRGGCGEKGAETEMLEMR